MYNCRRQYPLKKFSCSLGDYMNKRKISGIVITAIILLSGCSGDKKVKIALMTKLESGSIIGVSEANAAKMFIEEKRVKNIEIVPFDDGWEPDKTVKAYEAVRRSGINIIVTSHTSSCAVAISNAVNRDKVLMFVTGSATDRLSDKDDYIIRNIQDVRFEQKNIAEYIKTLNISSLLLIRNIENPAYSEPSLRYFRDYYKSGKMIVLDVKLSKFDPEQLAGKVKNLKFDALYLLIGGYKTAAGSIAQLVNNIRPHIPIVYTPWIKTPAIIETAGDSINNSIFPSIYQQRSLNPGVDLHFRKYRDKFKSTPTFISLNVYSALQILQSAIDRGHKDPDSIKEYIKSVRTFRTDFGTMTFNRFGDTELPFYFITDIRQEFK